MSDNLVNRRNKTMNKDISNIKALFIYASDKMGRDIGGLDVDRFDKTRAKVDKSRHAARQERAAFEFYELGYVLAHSAYWLGRRSERDVFKHGNVIVRDGRYWGIMLCVCLGLRRSEAAQLRREHIRRIDGIWAIDLFNTSSDEKSDSRIVPLSDRVLQLGFVEAVVERPDLAFKVEMDGLQATGTSAADIEARLQSYAKSRLFPEMRLGKATGVWGDRLQFFNELIVKLRLGGRKLTLHSTRHAIETALQNAGGIDPIWTSDLLGHDDRGSRDEQAARYGKGTYVATLKRAIDRWDPPVDAARYRAAYEAARRNDTDELDRIRTEIRSRFPEVPPPPAERRFVLFHEEE